MISKKLKYYRKINGLSQHSMAYLCGVSPNCIATIEARDSDVYLSTAIKVANALNIRIEQLVSPLTNEERELLGCAEC